MENGDLDSQLEGDITNEKTKKLFLDAIRSFAHKTHSQVLALGIIAGLAGTPACGSMDTQNVTQVEQHEDCSPFTIFFLTNLSDKNTGKSVGLSLNYRLPKSFNDVVIRLFAKDGSLIYEDSENLSQGSDRIFFTEDEIPGAGDAYRVAVEIDGKTVSGELDTHIDDDPIGQ
ncbi:hypothetical protein J7J83_04630 [bacterium]|nr:hypothetical protein [bacterium]